MMSGVVEWWSDGGLECWEDMLGVPCCVVRFGRWKNVFGFRGLPGVTVGGRSESGVALEDICGQEDGG